MSTPTSGTTIVRYMELCRRMGPRASQQAVKPINMPCRPYRPFLACLPLQGPTQTTTEVYCCTQEE